MNYEARKQQAAKDKYFESMSTIDAFNSGVKWSSENWNWIDISAGPPKDDTRLFIPCIVLRNAWVECLCWNQANKEWEDAQADRFKRYKFNEVEKYIVIKQP
jgi:hypothetical protein